jgi:GNAT superfamily N-acetyltransferase
MPRIKVFPVKFRPEEDTHVYEKEFGSGYESCEKINSAKVCDDRMTFKMLYCRKDAGPYKACQVIGEGDYQSDMTAYLQWYSAKPREKGHGKHFYEELEKFLHDKRCIRAIHLHALEAAESFWERMGFEPIDRNDPDTWEEWMDHHEHLNTFTKVLPRKKSCTPEKAVGGYSGPLRTPEPQSIDKNQRNLDFYVAQQMRKAQRRARAKVGRLLGETEQERHKLYYYR